MNPVAAGRKLRGQATVRGNPMSSPVESRQRAGQHRFRDRREAGRALAAALGELAKAEPIVVALPRGGVPVGYEVARELGAPLDIALVRKLGAPMQPELGIGALGEDGAAIVDTAAMASIGVSREQLAEIVARERTELARRAGLYRPGRPPLDVSGRVVVLVDDGIATGATAVAAARVLKARQARAVILAAPVCPRGVGERLESEFDAVLCLRSPEPFLGVGGAYEDFSQTTDDEVIELLTRKAPAEREDEETGEQPVSIPAGPGIALVGDLRTPASPTALVVFAHGSGSSRRSPRNRAVAERLNRAGLATLLVDLLTEDEARERANVFDIDLLAERLLAACEWAEHADAVADLPLGLFGASTGAAAALRAASLSGERRRRRGLARRSTRPRRRRTRPGHGADAADRRRRRQAGPGAEPRGGAIAGRPARARDRSRHRAPVRRTGCTRAGRRARRRLVRNAPRRAPMSLGAVDVIPGLSTSTRR